MKYYIGVDVGTVSVRSALFDNSGRLVKESNRVIQIWSPKPDYYEQSSDDIWNGVLHTVKKILSDSGVTKEQIGGIGFDATCSLVVIGDDGQPVTISPSDKSECNVIMWMDHRAIDQAGRINSTQHPVLKGSGGQISVEMEPPKLLWIKENLPKTWQKARHFFDLPDYLTWKATGSLSRSLCSLVCKWMYQADESGQNEWDDEFWNIVGLGDIVTEKYQRCGTDVKSPGETCGQGLTNEAAEQLGLVPGTPVGTSIIDAHAGVLGCIGCVAENDDFKMPEITSRLSMICGTSTCHMIMSRDAIFVPGVWGPYYSSILPGLWNSEGGQSAVGKVIDFVVESHPVYEKLKQTSDQEDVHVHTLLHDRLKEMTIENKLSSLSELTKNVHIWPDFHGNRSPLADPGLKGMMSGLTLSSDLDDLAVRYLATVQSLAYGTRHIIEELVKHGHKIEVLYMCGGLRKNQLYVETHVDVTGIPAILPHEEESVLLGSAILGASASGHFLNIQEAVEKMGGKGRLMKPNIRQSDYHDKKYKVFLKMVEHQKEYSMIMNSCSLGYCKSLTS